MDTGNQSACGADCNCRPDRGIARRDFLRAAGLTPLALMASRLPVMAGPFEEADPLPTDKKLDPAWVRSLTARGEPTIYRGTDLEKIGMPVGGIGAGQLYLGGDGKLWHWDLFNIPHGTGDGGYAHPPLPESPLEQGFAVEITANGKTQTRNLDHTGFADIRFSGQYPIGTVTYRDPAAPVTITLEAFSPFIPLNADDSSLPATVLHYTVKNIGNAPVEVTLAGWLQNAVLLFSPGQSGARHNRIVREPGMSALVCEVSKQAASTHAPAPDRVFEDWNRDSYAGWTVEGTAFGTRPLRRSEVPDYQGDLGGEGDRLVNSHASAPGSNVEERDRATGKLISSPFAVDHDYIAVWIGGGAQRGKTCLNVVVDGKVVRSLTGADNNRMTLQGIDMRALRGKQAVLEIVDAATGPWGNIGVGKITFTDHGAATGVMEELPDYGTLALALLGGPAEHTAAASEKAGFGKAGTASAEAPIPDPLIGALGRTMQIAPGQEHTATFVLTWHFPNLKIDGLGMVGRHYAVRFRSAQEVARYVADHFERLAGQTRLWRDTWYASTLPYWFLDRTLLNISTLATSACYRFANGRFYAWEGVGCCAGTCAHVWHYAQAMARLFPELERDTRERVDFGIAYHPDSGVIGFRAEFDTSLAVDGQAGTILRAYREHQMSPDDAFLRRNWPRIRGAFAPLFRLDGNDDGVLEGGQMNTLDQPWFGKIAWLSSLYAAALRAGEAMASEMGETEFAERCRTVADRGAKNIDTQLFNGEYYIQIGDPGHTNAVGSYDGCQIDQVFGDSWAQQVGLSGVLPQDHVRSALASLWKYNFLLDVGPYREAHRPGRWYALAGEAGLLMCSWPHGESKRASGGFDFYLNECMTGFEHQVAGHMVREGLVTEGMAVIRAIHDRYHASKRNPWNEVECGDHYSRAMASYGVFLGACGYEYHGPKAHLGFAPRFDHHEAGEGYFRAAFTAAEGWGSFARTTQEHSAGLSMQAEITPHWGQLRLKTLALDLPQGVTTTRVRVTLAGRAIPTTHTIDNGRLTLTLTTETTLKTGEKLEISVS